MVTIVNYSVGNLESIRNILKKIGVESRISSDEHDLQTAEKLILPGVGAFDTCAQKLNESGLLPMLNKRVLENKVPVLGICVGLQLMLNGSEEGELPGLSWVQGTCVKFKQELLPANFAVPHMGWTDVMPTGSSRLFEGIDEPRFYFVHSYHPQLANTSDALVTAKYGYEFVAGVVRENIMGVQFHPEKSHKFGMKLLENFIKYY